MSATTGKDARRRSIADRMICGYNACRYGLTEPLLLRLQRLRCGSRYPGRSRQPLISVYTPTYNRSQILLERAVASVLRQTYANFEYVIVGDCCTDRTGELLKEIGDPRIRFFNVPRRTYRYPPTAENHWLAGPVVAANTALGMCRGEWIARIDDDDIWTPDHLEVLLGFARDNGCEFVSSAYVAERHGAQVVVDVKDAVPRIGGTQTWLYRSYLKFMKYNINCWRKSWNRVNDTDMQDRMHRAGVRMGFCDKVTCYVLPRPGETTIGLEAYRLTAQEKVSHFGFHTEDGKS